MDRVSADLQTCSLDVAKVGQDGGRDYRAILPPVVSQRFNCNCEDMARARSFVSGGHRLAHDGWESVAGWEYGSRCVVMLGISVIVG